MKPAIVSLLLTGVLATGCAGMNVKKAPVEEAPEAVEQVKAAVPKPADVKPAAEKKPVVRKAKKSAKKRAVAARAPESAPAQPSATVSAASEPGKGFSWWILLVILAAAAAAYAITRSRVRGKSPPG